MAVPVLELALEKNEGVQCFNVSEAYSKALHVLFTQMSVLKWIKLFGEQAVSAMFMAQKKLNDGVFPGKLVIEPIPFNACEKYNKNALIFNVVQIIGALLS